MLFLGCFVALIATAFGFIVRAMLINTWGVEFNLTETQKGEIFGVGLWPFAISIVLFSLVIDRVGYGKAMVFAFLCHVSSAVLTIFAWDYWSLYWATFIVALGNGTVEAVINPVVATMFVRDKTKWLNILHAGWPGGLVLGGLLAIALGDVDWRYKVGLLLIPAVLYGIMLLGKRFPIQERVAAGVSHRDMLREAGGLGMLIVVFLIASELGRVFGFGTWVVAGVSILIAGAFGAYVGGMGRPMFIFLLLVMMPLATTELGVDSWITPLMEGEMQALDLSPVWVLIYTAFIMMILRLYAGAIVHRLSPLGLLAISALIAALGLVFLSKATGMMIFVAATAYGVGKTFFWPTMLGVVSEQFPKGGALTLNAMGGVGMLSVGVVGAVFLGYIQDTATAEQLQAEHPALHASVVVEKESVLGSYDAIDPERLATRSDDEKKTIETITASAQKGALTTVAIFPVIMLVCYLGLALYFRSKGGYRAEVLTGHAADDEAFTGGTTGPGEG